MNFNTVLSQVNQCSLIKKNQGQIVHGIVILGKNILLMKKKEIFLIQEMMVKGIK